MIWVALKSGGKDSILSCQKTIDKGNTVEYVVTSPPKNQDLYRFHSANRFPVIADVVSMVFLELQGGNTEEELAGGEGEYESTLPYARLYSRPLTFELLEIISESTCNELVPGGFA
jgi:hypothetical protein